MKMAWIEKAESGFRHDEFGGTHVYDCGKTLAQKFPEQYFQCPKWAAAILDVTHWLHGKAHQLCAKWDKEGAR